MTDPSTDDEFPRRQIVGAIGTAVAVTFGLTAYDDVESALFGTPQERMVVDSIGESPYIDGAHIRWNDSFLLTDDTALVLELPRNPPEWPDYYALLRNGEQDHGAQTAPPTGQSATEIGDVYSIYADEYDELVVIGGGEYTQRKVYDGEILDRVPISLTEIEVEQ
jgi:hypothetical protein